ncbi:protein disulfide isomerase family A, member 6 [Rhizoctonia solani]|uniref:protein disulfide-isomerase n=1 Tax=Rhizoctonia solani TaxID=456999 RepID=A0A0K6FSI4_9AGAM|nr:protein disulfide isomerase family A, member 6 [Rhizoctonia solani]
MRALTFFFTSAWIAGALASNVVEVTSKNFNSIIGQGKPALVEFYAPWCGHCKNLAPVYEQLADAFAHAKDKVLIVKADADGEAKEIAGKHGVTGFPTLKWFGADDATKSDPYEGGRELNDLASFVEKSAGVKSNIKPPPPPETPQLSYRDFDEIVMDPENDVLVAFTAPWCGHCKALKPTLEKVSKTFKPDSKCIIANYDADNAMNKDIAARAPLIKAVSYDFGRSEADFVKFLNENCGTQRAVGGGLNELAGRLPTLDSLAQSFYSADKAVRETLYTEAKAAGENASYYIRVMEKLTSTGEAWIEKEHKRLEGILGKRSMAQTKLDEIKKKVNVLNAFLEKKVEEVKEAVEETAEKVKEEL